MALYIAVFYASVPEPARRLTSYYADSDSHAEILARGYRHAGETVAYVARVVAN